MLINLSAAQLGVVVAALEISGTEYTSEREVENITQEIKDTVLYTLGSEYYDMWLDEFDIID